MAIQWKRIYKIGILAGSIALILATLACDGSRTESTVGTTENPSSADASTPVTVEPTQQRIAQADIDILRRLTFDYWDALNSYDVEKALSYLEDNYRQVHAGDVKDGIRQMKMFRVKLRASEESSPRVEGQDQGEMYITLKDPRSTRRILMEFAKVAGEWKITFAEEVE